MRDRGDSNPCERARRALHARHNVSRLTTCVGVHDACVVGERIVLGPGRTSEAAALSTFFEPLVGDYTWADRKGHITARGTFSAVDSQPTRYCSYNATIWKVSDGKCHGDRDEGDAVQRWVHVDAAATSRSVWRAPRRRFGMAWWPTYPQSYSETFGNQALALHQMQAAHWLPPDADLLPASSWFDFWISPFSATPLQTLQRLELAGETRCYRTLALCSLASYALATGKFRAEGGWRPWATMQLVAATLGPRALQRAVKDQARAWRQPSLLHPATVASTFLGSTVGTPVLRVVFAERRGRRRLANAAQLIARLDSVRIGRARLEASMHAFGAREQPFVHDLQAARRADVLIGSHGADLLNGLLMHAGASIIEVRGALFTASLGVWAAWYEWMYGFDDVVHHYALQLGLNDTVGAASLAAQHGSSLTPHHTWNLPLEPPFDELMRVLRTIVDVNGQRERYYAIASQPPYERKGTYSVRDRKS